MGLRQAPNRLLKQSINETTDALAAVGDIHGDIVKAAAALCAAGVLGEEDGLPIWTGGDTTIVQIGDVLDRGDSEIGEPPA